MPLHQAVLLAALIIALVGSPLGTLRAALSVARLAGRAVLFVVYGSAAALSSEL